MRTRVYVAGPISQGDVAENVRNAQNVGMALLKLGYAPMVPHGSCFWGNRISLRDAFHAEKQPAGTTHAEWIGVDLSWVAVSHAVLRLPGPSTGAEMECAEARRLGIPVFFDLKVLCDRIPIDASAASMYHVRQRGDTSHAKEKTADS